MFWKHCRNISDYLLCAEMFGKCLEYLKEHMRPSFLFRGCATQHVVGGCEPRMSYRYWLKVTSPKGAFAYSPVISVFPMRK